MSADEDVVEPVEPDVVSGKKIPLSELVSRISAISGQPKNAVTAVLSAFKVECTRATLSGETVDLGRDFGKFKLKTIKGRAHTVPSKEGVTISEDRPKLRFLPSAQLLKKPVVT